jgi:hypothetical protein
VNRTILIAASFLRVSNVDHGCLAETLHAGWGPAERQLPPDTPRWLESHTRIFELSTMIEDRAGA